MGLSLKKIAKGVKKFAKGAVKVVKKVAPIVVGLTGVGGVIGGIATKAVTAVSKVKSKGVNVAKISPVATAIKVSSAVRRKPAPETAPKKKSPKTKAPSQAALKRVYAEWKASDQSVSWEDYAQEALNR